jgi:hypothetical protein
MRHLKRFLNIDNDLSSWILKKLRASGRSLRRAQFRVIRRQGLVSLR